MEFRKVGGTKKYFKYSECEEGQVLVTGKYLGTSPNKFGKENHDFKPIDGGPVVCLNSAGHLNWLLESEVEEGDIVQVTYAGTDVLEKGTFKGKEVHKFEVAIADGSEPKQPELFTTPVDAKVIKEVEKKTKAPKAKEASKTVDLSDLD